MSGRFFNLQFTTKRVESWTKAFAILGLEAVTTCFVIPCAEQPCPGLAVQTGRAKPLRYSFYAPDLDVMFGSKESEVVKLG